MCISSESFFLITLLTFLHRDKGPLVYACFIKEFCEPWAYRHIFISLFFLPSYYCIPSYLISCVLHLSFFILSTTCFASYSPHPEWWSSSVHYMGDSHIISTIYPTDTDLEILSLRRSSCQREFFVTLVLGSVSIHYWYHFWGSFVYVQGMCICIYVKQKKIEKKIDETKNIRKKN